MSARIVPQTAFQWFLALVVTPLLTVLLTHILDQIQMGNNQAITWESEDANCYLDHVKNITPILKNNHHITSMTCPSANTWIRVSTSDGQDIVNWIFLSQIISHGSFNLGQSFFRQIYAFSPEDQDSDSSTITQSINQNVTICKTINNDTMTYVIKRPNGNSFKEKLNIRTGQIFESKEVPCNTNCD